MKLILNTQKKKTFVLRSTLSCAIKMKCNTYTIVGYWYLKLIHLPNIVSSTTSPPSLCRRLIRTLFIPLKYCVQKTQDITFKLQQLRLNTELYRKIPFLSRSPIFRCLFEKRYHCSFVSLDVRLPSSSTKTSVLYAKIVSSISLFLLYLKEFRLLKKNGLEGKDRRRICINRSGVSSTFGFSCKNGASHISTAHNETPRELTEQDTI